MFKRCISSLLIVALLSCFLAVPALADEVDNWVNLLDYGYANNGTSNKIYVEGGSGTTKITYNVPGGGKVYYVDLYVLTNASDLEVSRSSSSNYLTVETVSGHMKHVYGWVNTSSDKLNLYFHYSDCTYIDIKSLYGSMIETESFSLSNVVGSGYAYSAPTNIPIGFTALNQPILWSYSSYDEWFTYMGSFSLYVDIVDWKKYDYIDLDVSFAVEGLTSIGAYIGSQFVPCEVNYIYDDTSYGFFMASVRLDLTGLSSLSDNDVTVLFQGNGIWDPDGQHRNIITIRTARGHVIIEPPSLWSFWFSNVQSWLSSGFSSVASSLSSLGTNITGLFNDLRNWISSGYLSVTTSISSWGQSLKDSVDALPDKIAEALKDLVVPAAGSVESMATKSEALVSDRFGGVFEGAQIVDNWASQLQSQTATQILTIPVVNLNILGSMFPLGGWEVDLIPEGFEIIFESVKIIIDILATAAFVNGIKNRLEKTLEG